MGACDGVAEPGVDDSCRAVSILSLAIGKPAWYSSTYSQEACRAPAEDAVRITDGSLAPGCSACSPCCRGGCCALDIVIEALDDIPGARLFEVLCLDSQDVIFEL